MRLPLSILVALGLAAPAFAGHDTGVPPGQGSADRNMDGETNGKDYAPGQSAAEAVATDVDGNGTINGQDYAPGQRREK